jgi:hypothetical protein
VTAVRRTDPRLGPTSVGRPTACAGHADRESVQTAFQGAGRAAASSPAPSSGSSSDFQCLETRAHSCYPLVVAVPVQHASFVVDCSFGDDEVGDRRSVPHAAVVG